MRIVVATNNAKKRREIEAILGAAGAALVPAAETAFVGVVEDGVDFAASARKKAEPFAVANRRPALADDSGLCVDALDGAPGVRSARFAGEQASDAANNALLLRRMEGIENRAARFVCHVCLAFPDGRAPIEASGSVAGEILTAPAGAGGFGYDPLFFCPELGKAFAQATPEEKARVSHRGRALAALARLLDTHAGR